MDIDQFLGAEATGWTVPDRLRWTSDFLDLASKAIAIVACAQGLDYPPDLHRAAQSDLREWARYLDDRPSIAADFELASLARWRPGMAAWKAVAATGTPMTNGGVGT